MAKFFQRIGTKQQVFSYDITVHSLQLALKLPVRINIIWKRRKKRIETKLKPALSPAVGSVEINETLTMINTLYLDKNGKFQRKKAVLTVQAILDGQGMKKVGQVSLNISDYFQTPLREQYISLQDCPDKAAKLCLSVSASPLGDIVEGDNQSEASGYTGLSMGTQGNLDVELFEQDLGGIEPDDPLRSPRILKANTTKPPRQQLMRLPELGGAVNPLRLNESIASKIGDDENLREKTEKLERENFELNADKQELKAQLLQQTEANKKERENLFAHMKELDTQNVKQKRLLKNSSAS